MLYGFAMGVAAFAATAVFGFALGFGIAFLPDGWLNLGETGAWVPFIALMYGIDVGIIVGLVVWGWICINGLRKQPDEKIV